MLRNQKMSAPIVVENSGMDEDDNQEKTEPGLLSLPNEILLIIFAHLDVDTLKSLRLVCRQAKSLVENAQFLRKFQLEVTDRDDRYSVVLSEVQWNCFKFCVLPDDVADSFFPLLFRFGPTMNHITFHFSAHCCDASTFMIEIMRCLGRQTPQLESLSFTGNGEAVALSEDTFFNPWIQLLEEPKDKFALNELQRITVGVFTTWSTCRTSEYFAGQLVFFLLNCPKLRVVNMPYGKPFPSIDGVSSPGLSIIQFLRQHEYKQMTTGVVAEKPKTKTTDIIFDRIPSSRICPMDFVYQIAKTRPVLVELVKLCESTSARLFNLPSAALPSLAVVARKWTCHEIQCLNHCVQSISSTGYMINILQSQLIPTGVTLDISLKFGQNIVENYEHFQLPQSLKISTLHLTNCAAFQVNGLSDLCWQSLMLHRPSVTEITLSNHSRRGWRNSWIPLLNINFPHLRKLELLGGNFKFPYADMMCLEELSLIKVRIEGGFDQLVDARSPYPHPFVRTIKRLVHFTLRHLKKARELGISNLCFQHLFRYMKPKTFVFQPVIPTSVTFHGGISTLASIEDGFKTTVTKFMIDFPDDISYDYSELSDFIMSFKYCREIVS